jgi:hypothetical protein
MLGACYVVDRGGGYYDEPSVSYGIGFYEPWGYGYGYGGDGWGRSYRVGPPRGGERRSAESPHRYRSAARSRATPSLPTRSRPSRAPR